MTRRPAGRWLIEAAVASALFAVVSAWAAATQPAERIFGDAQMYHRMAQQFGEGQLPVAVEAPFVYRPATPWLASVFNPLLSRVLPRGVDFAIEGSSGLKGVPGFYLVNIVATFVTVHLLVVWMRLFDLDVRLRLLALTLWLIEWYAPTRFVYFYPVNAEPLFLLSVVATLLVTERLRRAPVGVASLAVTPILFVGTLARESIVVVLAAFLASRMSRAAGVERWRLASLTLPIAAVAAALALTRAIAAPTNTFNVAEEAIRLAGEKPFFTWVLAWCFTFGPSALAVALAGHRDSWSFLKAHPHLALYLVLVAFLAFVGGTDTERILGWAAPVVFLLTARVTGQQATLLQRRPVLTTVLILVQLASARVFWPIPVGVDDARTFASLGLEWSSVMAMLDKALVIENYYANLWSFFGSRAVHAWILVADLGFMASVVWLLKRDLAAAARPHPSGSKSDAH